MTEKTPILLMLVAAAALIGGVIFILSSHSADDLPVDETITALQDERDDDRGDNVLTGSNSRDREIDGSGPDRSALIKIETFGAGTPKGAYRGRVITDSSLPVPDASVLLFESESGMFVEQSRFTGLRAATNKQGEFTLEQVPVGHAYRIKCRSRHRALSNAACPPIKAGEIVALADIVLHDGITLSGTVTDAEDRPIAGARVTASDRGDLEAALGADEGGSETLSDREGHYAIAHLGPYQYDVTAAIDGYVPASRSLLLGFLGSSDKEARLDIQMEKGVHSVFGRVQTREAKSLPRATVVVSTLGQALAGRFTREVVADAKGAFSIDGLPESRCMITAAARGHFLKSPTVFVPGSEEIVVELDARGAVKGRVTPDNASKGQGSVAVAGFQPRWSQSRPETPGAVDIGRDGRFRFLNLLPGKYVFIARVDGFAWSTSDEITVDMGKTTSDVAIGLVHGGSIKGRLSDGKGRPAEGFEIRLMHKDFQPGLLLGLRTEAPAEQGKVLTSDDKGGFLLDDVLPGEYSLEITGAGMAGKLLRQINVEEAKVFDTGTITVTAGARLIGTAFEQSGRPAKGARVVAMNQENGLCKTAITDNNGFFRMNALAAGSYIVYLENSSWSDLGSRSDLVIQVREAQTEKVEIRVRPAQSGEE